jgi:ubiquitin carboxyl-terminal hydrolase 4/11/15
VQREDPRLVKELESQDIPKLGDNQSSKQSYYTDSKQPNISKSFLLNIKKNIENEKLQQQLLLQQQKQQQLQQQQILATSTPITTTMPYIQSNINTTNNNNNILSIEKRKKRLEVGLENLGNTCFMNSTLQCLLHIKPLIDFFLENDITLVINKSSPSKGLLAISFNQLVRDIYEGSNGNYVSPYNFQRVVSFIIIMIIIIIFIIIIISIIKRFVLMHHI